MNLNVNNFLIQNSSVAGYGSQALNRGRELQNVQPAPVDNANRVTTADKPAEANQAQKAGASRSQNQVNNANNSESLSASFSSTQLAPETPFTYSDPRISREQESTSLGANVIGNSDGPVATRAFQQIANLGTAGNADNFRLIDTFV